LSELTPAQIKSINRQLHRKLTDEAPVTTEAPAAPVEEVPEEEKKEEEEAPKSEEVEAPTTEESVPEEPKAEEPKAEEPKAEEPKAEEPKAEEPKAEEPKAEEPKAEEPKAEEPKAEEPKVEEPKVEEPKVEEPKVEEPKPEVVVVEEPIPEVVVVVPTDEALTSLDKAAVTHMNLSPRTVFHNRYKVYRKKVNALKLAQSSLKTKDVKDVSAQLLALKQSLMKAAIEYQKSTPDNDLRNAVRKFVEEVEEKKEENYYQPEKLKVRRLLNIIRAAENHRK